MFYHHFTKKNSNLCKIGIKKKAKIKNPEHRNNILNLLWWFEIKLLKIKGGNV